LLTNEPILRLPQFDKPFQVETDASDYGCGGVLTQEHDGIWHPIAYFSQSFTGAQTRYSTSEKELYAIADWVHEKRKEILKNVKKTKLTSLPA
jgi:hypothetical protein